MPRRDGDSARAGRGEGSAAGRTRRTRCRRGGAATRRRSPTARRRRAGGRRRDIMTSVRRVIRTMCPMNCHPTLCGMLVEVEDGRVTRVTGDPDNPDSRGFLCVRGQAAPEILDNRRRLLYPMTRDTRRAPCRRVTWAAARRRGAGVVTIDVRETEAAALSDDTLLIRPGTDAALALAMLHVIVAEGLVDREFVARHTVGVERLVAHLDAHTPAWAASITGIAAERIVALARRYATTRPAMIVVGGSSMHKASNGWHAARAIACLPALTGQVGIAGGGLGPRHGASLRGQVLGNIVALERRPPGDDVPNQMSRITEALVSGRVRVLLLFGTDMLSSFADANRVAEGLARQDLVVSYDLFENDTARRFADILLPSTSWVEELGCKATNTHLYLMPPAVAAPGETRSLPWVLRALAERLGLDDFFPWKDDAALIDTMLDAPATGHATVEALAAEGGMRAMNVSHVGHPDLTFPTPSGKLEFFSERAVRLGLPGLPVFEPPAESSYPLTLRHGRTLTAFHGFYDHGLALPSLAKADPEPVLWISPADAASRGVADGAAITMRNARGEMACPAHVTPRIPTGTVWMRDG